MIHSLVIALVLGVSFDDAVMAGLCWTALSVSYSSCCISLAPLLSPMFLIALAQSVMAAMILSAWFMVGFVMRLWLNCAVLVRRSVFVVFMWH